MQQNRRIVKSRIFGLRQFCQQISSETRSKYLLNQKANLSARRARIIDVKRGALVLRGWSLSGSPVNPDAVAELRPLAATFFPQGKFCDAAN
jgi:hypothetical protein